ncbi:MAG: hypothetical protein PWR27_1261 [Petroclostridium sp.]|jgi:hypothetical protein|uniref:hypothetical protein n=1 Tax=Petroclostridium xylanilyticum TaxID=1792311 RepID=UPI000B97DD34|nr:hypothetical protein [Petroclostridium xylanilyticum]MBZ4644687.1 hypothetical protein [Clostridia bacterium]MDK2810552.1 hypothetical protein [Petroclostridium sp.]
MEAKENKNTKKVQGLMYKGKPLTRKGDMLYYGNHDDKYIITMKVQESKVIKNLKVATKVSIELQINNPALRGKEKVVKKAEREGLYRALEIGSIWLEDALSS